MWLWLIGSTALLEKGVHGLISCESSEIFCESKILSLRGA